MDPNETPVDEIPGIGVIRARALKKAGWNTIGDLRKLSLEELAAVRGITEVKAGQILEFVRSLEPAPAKVARPRTRRAAPKPVEAPAVEVPAVQTDSVESISVTFLEAGAEAEIVPIYALQSPRDLMQDVALSAQLLLTSEFAGKWERPFTAQLGKLISLHDRWDRHEPLSKKQTKLAMEILQKIYRLLTETPVSEITKRKTQENLGEVLRDRRRRLRDILET